MFKRVCRSTDWGLYCTYVNVNRIKMYIIVMRRIMLSQQRGFYDQEGREQFSSNKVYICIGIS